MTEKKFNHKELIISIQESPSYAALLISLALMSGSLVVYEWWPGKDEALLHFLLGFDFYIACLFLLDFLLAIYACHGYTDRLTYFKHNWMNLISSIPVTNEVTQTLRLLRIWRAWRVLRVAVGIHSLWRFFARMDKHISQK